MSVMREKKQVLYIHKLKNGYKDNKSPAILLAQHLAFEQDM